MMIGRTTGPGWTGPDRTAPKQANTEKRFVRSSSAKTNSHDDQDGSRERSPRMSPNVIAFVVPAVDEVNDRVDSAGHEAEGIGEADGERVIDQPGKQHPAVVEWGVHGATGESGMDAIPACVLRRHEDAMRRTVLAKSKLYDTRKMVSDYSTVLYSRLKSLDLQQEVYY